ncbi:enoyl-CoA hydratase/isomerase family protein [Lentibacter algarum]|uniref:enoyl-CoA hydratase-related protein n=1 Tax=Lentibacter algarum TaxID=576131 RepID=UPI001C09FD96|nr:enoyl-CoA hydratase-related protein [Lentibacter algarum]MBU2983364.1 enoyl-CoA hydratase/isomerase family protein [Lentibacter algarum]
MSARLEDKGSYLIVHNSDEKRGALSASLVEALTQAAVLACEPRIGCFVLTGGAFFCSGGDLNVLITRREMQLDERISSIGVLNDMIRAVHDAPVPVVAAIEGGAAGAGLSLALACDLVVAAKGAQFSAAYVKAGLTPDGALTHSLSRALPRQLVMEICLLGRAVTTEKLAGHGLIYALSEPGAALAEAEALAQMIAKGPRVAQSRIKALVNRAVDSPFEDILNQETKYMAEAQGGQEAAEGISAFLQKRATNFEPDKDA